MPSSAFCSVFVYSSSCLRNVSSFLVCVPRALSYTDFGTATSFACVDATSSRFVFIACKTPSNCFLTSSHFFFSSAYRASSFARRSFPASSSFCFLAGRALRASRSSASLTRATSSSSPMTWICRAISSSCCDAAFKPSVFLCSKSAFFWMMRFSLSLSAKSNERIDLTVSFSISRDCFSKLDSSSLNIVTHPCRLLRSTANAADTADVSASDRFAASAASV
mmetsp:Transcript_7646/g.18938  ORF Transcript_7646/g.18938 Transcript_7646/m.18938 type:complete len:222 (-) Transcript_7646:1049-1714(-)